MLGTTMTRFVIFQHESDIRIVVKGNVISRAILIGRTYVIMVELISLDRRKNLDERVFSFEYLFRSICLYKRSAIVADEFVSIKIELYLIIIKDEYVLKIAYLIMHILKRYLKINNDHTCWLFFKFYS